MSIIWWLLPTISFVLGVMLMFAGIGKLFKLKPFSGLSRLLFSAGFLGLGGVAALTGLNLQTYKRLTFERPVATISFAATPTAERYGATLLYPGGEQTNVTLSGNEWELNARVVKFQAFSNLLGFNSLYKLDRLYGRFEDVERAGETNGLLLTTDPWIDMVAVAKERGGRFGVEDSRYGSAVYNPMDAGLSYIVCMTQTGLIARPNNQITADRLGTVYNPSQGCALDDTATVGDAAVASGVEAATPLAADDASPAIPAGALGEVAPADDTSDPDQGTEP